jgi:hypothetical protein
MSEAVGDLITTTIALLQYYFVISWFRQLTQSQDSHHLCWYMFLLAPTNILILILCMIYISGGAWLIVAGRYNQFNTYQDAVTLGACLLYGILGLWYVIRAHMNANVLDMSVESYTVLRRSRLTSGVLSICCLFASVFSALSLFGSGVSDYVNVNVMETKYYICHRIPCLVSFLIRVVFIVTLPNWALSWMFSSPPERDLHLIPIAHSSQVKHSLPESEPLLDITVNE